MADATKFKNYHNQSNELVALEWLIDPLNEQFDALHNNGVLWSDFAKTYQAIGNVLTMANVPSFATLAFLIGKMAKHPDYQTTIGQSQLVCVSYALYYELNHYVCTGFLHDTLLKLKSTYLSYLLGESGFPKDIPNFSEKITLVTTHQSNSTETDNQNLQLWRTVLTKLHQNANQQQSFVNDLEIASQINALKQVVFALCGASESLVLQKLWMLAALWLDELSTTHQNFTTIGLFERLYQAYLLSDDVNGQTLFWLENLLADIYVALATLHKPSSATQQLLESLEDKHLIEKDFFVYVLTQLQSIDATNSWQNLDTLQTLKQLLLARGWSMYASQLDDVIGQITKGQNVDLTNLCHVLQTLLQFLQQSSIQEPSTLTNAYHILEITKQQFSNYLSSKDVADLPKADDFYRLQNGFEKVALLPISALCQQFFDVFSVLYKKAPKRISWQLAHQVADSLLLFELFLDGLSRQRFDHSALEQTKQHLNKALALIDDLVDEVDEVFDIYAKLLQAHQQTTLYDDAGSYEPVAGEVISVAHNDSWANHKQNDAHIEEALVSDIILPTKQSKQAAFVASSPIARPITITQTPTPFIADEYKSSNIFLTDILSIPSITLSHQDNHNDIKAMAAYAMMGEEVAEDLTPIEEMLKLSKYHLRKDISESNGQLLPAENMTAKPLSVYKEFVEEIHQVNNNHNTTLSQSLVQSPSDAYLALKNTLKADDFSFDEEFREIFIEEVDEVMEQMHESLPKWQKDITDTQELTQIRRYFHTLKGSGRMVGAFCVGETAWAIENLLNRVLDGVIEVNEQIATLVSNVADIIPVMVQDFAQKNPPSIDNVAFILQAENILAGKPINEGLTTTTDVLEQSVVDENTVNAIEQEPIIDVAQNEVVLPEILTSFMEEASKPLVPILPDADADIRAIFVEEAQEILTQIIPKFTTWRKDRSQHQLLVDVRCGFHALKGSGRTVGAAELGELAWAIENLLNRVLDESLTISDAMVVLISDVLADFEHLVSLFNEGATSYPEQVVLWIACANAYSQGYGDQFDYRVFSRSTKDHSMDWSLDEQDDLQDIVADMPKEEQSCQSTQVLGFIQEAKDIILNVTPKTPDDEEEEMLCQIFVEEGRELLTEVKAFLQQNQDKDSVPVSDRIVRAFHTLRGAAGLPPLAPVGEVGAIIEHGLQSLQQHDAPMGPTHLQALVHAVELIEGHLSAYEDADDEHGEEIQDFAEDKHTLTSLLDTDQDEMSDISALIDGVDALLDAEMDLEKLLQQTPAQIINYANKQTQEVELLSARTLEFPKFQAVLSALAQAYQLLAQHPDCIDNELVQALLVVHRELVGLFDSLAGSMSLRVDEVALHRLSAWQDNYLASLESSATNPDNQADELNHHTKPTRKTVIVEELVLDNITTDDELLDIFLTEAQEILERSAENFRTWQADVSNIELTKILQRDLTTLAGGSSLAGVMSIHQLAEAAEKVFEGFKTGQLTINGDWLDILQQVYDVFALQMDFIKNRHQSFFVDNAIEDLQRYLVAGTLTKGATIRTPVVEIEIDAIQDEEEKQSVEELVVETSSPPVDVQQFIKDSWQGALPDKDILDIFLEEAKDLAESSSEDFAVFRNNTSDIETLHALQRKLHTIKGGARMVSVNGVADLAHEMETIYEDLGAHRYPANQSVVNLLFACHDWIVAAIGLLKSQYNPPRPTLLIDALHQFIQNPDSVVAVPSVSLANEAQMLAQQHSPETQLTQTDISQLPPMQGVFDQKAKQQSNTEMIRIAVPMMEEMINLSGETAINRARIDMSIVGLTASIEEMGVTVQRLADQLRRMDIELEAQILSQIDGVDKLDASFDPLEMDQYSSLNQLSKSLSESASDLLDIKTTLLDKTRSSESLLLQLSRIQTELQDKLMGSRMVPFSRLTPRLHRIVRQTANELGKMVELTVVNADGEVDRTILEHITSPLEHMLRNAIDHGIEFPEQRSELGKSTTGQIKLQVQREGNELVVLLSDDGAGINVNRVRQKIISQGLIHPDDKLSDNDIIQYIFNAGLSTAGKVTQISGRGVGMDVVRTEIRQLGGSVSVESTMGQGSCFVIRVPLVVALSDVLVVRVADHQYAVPLVQIERVIQVDVKELLAHYQSDRANIDLEGQEYRLRYLNEILSNRQFSEDGLDSHVPVIIAKSQVGSFALQVDEIVGSRMEVVAKPLGNQLSRLSGISAATIMGDGSVMLILDLPALMRTPQQRHTKEDKPDKVQRHLIMVIDDSVTVRKVTSRFLERQGFDVVVAKDGVHAIEILQDTVPDLMLLDIEMPRMDGFEVATQVRHSQRLKNVPIIMITSRTGEKHRKRAFEIGVDAYLGKPFQEMQLLANIHTLLKMDIPT